MINAGHDLWLPFEIDTPETDACIGLRREKGHTNLLSAVEADPVETDGITNGLLL